MTPYKPVRGSYEIDRIFRGLGRVRLRTGTYDKRIAERYEVMLEDLPLDVVRLLRDKVLGLRETYDLWSRGETKLIPSAILLRPLIATMQRWAAEHETEISAGEHDARLRLIRDLATTGDARVLDLPALVRGMRETHRTRGAKFNHARGICLAFARDVLGKRSETHSALADVRQLPTPPKLARHPCTVQEAKAVRAALPRHWAAIWWALCTTSMGPKEYFVDGWTVRDRGIEIHGQKWSARERIVPLVVVPPKVTGSADGFEAALYRAKLGVAPYDARRSYERWLQELRFPAYRQSAYMGHGPKSMTELYAWGDIREWLAEDGKALREYVGEPMQLRVQA